MASEMPIDTSDFFVMRNTKVRDITRIVEIYQRTNPDTGVYISGDSLTFFKNQVINNVVPYMSEEELTRNNL